MRENPVKRPMVPPNVESISACFTALSFVILSNVGVSKKILTNRSSFFHSKAKHLYDIWHVYGNVVVCISQTFQIWGHFTPSCVISIIDNFLRYDFLPVPFNHNSGIACKYQASTWSQAHMAPNFQFFETFIIWTRGANTYLLLLDIYLFQNILWIF